MNEKKAKEILDRINWIYLTEIEFNDFMDILEQYSELERTEQK